MTRRTHLPSLAIAFSLGGAIFMPAFPAGHQAGMATGSAAFAAIASLFVIPKSRLRYHGFFASLVIAHIAVPATRSVNLGYEIATYVVIAIGLTQMIDALGRNTDRFRSLFGQAPISLWEEDFSEVAHWLSGLRSEGVTDLDAYLTEHPEQVDLAIGMVAVTNVNAAAANLVEVASPLDLMGRLVPETFTQDTRPAFMVQLRAIFEGATSAVTETQGVTAQGRPLDCILKWAAPTDFLGRPDYRRVMVSISDVGPLKLAEKELRESNDLLNAIAAAQRAFSSRLLRRISSAWSSTKSCDSPRVRSEP